MPVPIMWFFQVIKLHHLSHVEGKTSNIKYNGPHLAISWTEKSSNCMIKKITLHLAAACHSEIQIHAVFV